MTISRRTLLGTATAAAAVPLVRPRAQGAPTIKIGVLNDMSGPYMAISGPTSIVCCKQALEDFGVAGKGLNVELVSADHQNKPDLAVSIARQWYDRDGVDMIIDVPTSSVALAVSGVAREKNKVFICSDGRHVGSHRQGLLAQHGALDVRHLHAGEIDRRSDGEGGRRHLVLSHRRLRLRQAVAGRYHELHRGRRRQGRWRIALSIPGTTDFSSFLVQAQSSGAKVLGLCNAGADTVNSIKQAHEFGLSKTTKLAALLMFVNDVHALGLDTAQGLNLTESFYWDLNDRTRAFTDRVRSKTPSNLPSMGHAGCYSGTLHYLKTAHDMGPAEAKKNGVATVARMKKIPVDDDCFGKTTIREDGRNLTPAYLFEVKKPSESKGPWDYYKQVAMTPGTEAYRPLSEGHCEFIGKA